MNKAFTSAMLAMLGILGIVGCGGEASSANPAPLPVTTVPGANCVPNQQNDCQCANGAQGKQTCMANGQTYGSCVCLAQDAGNVDSGESGSDTGNDGAAQLPLLTISFDGPEGGYLTSGQKNVVLETNTLCAKANLTVNELQFALNGMAKFAGTNGNLLRNLKLVRHNEGTTVSGPVELSNLASFAPRVVFPDDWDLSSDECAALDLVADLSEDAGKECASCTFQAALLIPAQDDGLVLNSYETLGPDRISPTQALESSTFIIANGMGGSLYIKRAASPVSGTVVKKTQKQDVLGLELSAAIHDMQLTNVTLQCQASINGAAYATTDCWKRVTSLEIFDGTTQLGGTTSPDMASGLGMPITTNYTVAQGMTKQLTVKASFASTASADEPYDKVSVGIAGVEVLDLATQAKGAVVDASVTADQLSQTPAVFTTVVPSGTLTIWQNGHPSSDIVVAGKDSWVPFARYRASGSFESMTIDRISVDNLPGGDNADFMQIGISTDGAVKGASVLPAGNSGSVDIDLSANPIQVPNGFVDFEIWAKIVPVMASATVNGAWQGVCRSGHAPALGLTSNKQSGEWDANYAGKLNTRTTGDKSGERIYAVKGAAPGNAMVIRGTKPVVTTQNLANPVLFHGEVELYRAQIGADSSGSVSLKQIGFRIDVSSGLSLVNFRLFRGAYQVPLNEYEATDMAHATDLKVGTTQAGETNLFVVISFDGEEIVSGSGNVYYLRATANYSGNGHYVITKLMTGGVYPFTGWPQGNTVLGPPEIGSPFIFHVTNGGGYGLGTLLWSDQSEIPHSTASLDWTDDYLVQDLTQSATISN